MQQRNSRGTKNMNTTVVMVTLTFFILLFVASFMKKSADFWKSSLAYWSVFSGSNRDDANSSTEFASFKNTSSLGPPLRAHLRSSLLTCGIIWGFAKREIPKSSWNLKIQLNHPSQIQDVIFRLYGSVWKGERVLKCSN